MDLRHFSHRVKSLRVVSQHKLGPASELYIKQQNNVVFKGSSSDVLVKVNASALNRADLLLREGKYPGQKEPKHLGLEISGKVEVVGNKVKKFKAGDRVMALLSGGGYSDFVVVDQNHLMPIPKNVSTLHAGGIPEVWLTAYQLIHFIAKLKKGENILIHAGGSGVGTAAVQLSKLAGAKKIIVTAGSEQKIEKALTLGATCGINYKNTPSFSTTVLQLTNGKGCSVILDCIGGSYLQENLTSISRDGRWVLYGLMGGTKIESNLLAQILGKRIALLGTTLMTRTDEYKNKLIDEFIKNALPYFDSEPAQLKPIVDKVYQLDEVVQAHEYMSTNQNKGKILLSMNNKSN